MGQSPDHVAAAKSLLLEDFLPDHRKFQPFHDAAATCGAATGAKMPENDADKMKKIGIITMHRVLNYGSVLQAYALCRIVEQMGNHVELIDYVFPNSANCAKQSWRTQTARLARQVLTPLFLPWRTKRRKKFSRFLRDNLPGSARRYATPEALLKHPPHYDVYLTGSDQVWSAHHVGADLTFLLPFAPAHARKVSYAASFGAGELPETLRPCYAELLQRYQAISVREPSGQQKVAGLCGRQAEIVLDPTLLLSGDEWRRKATPESSMQREPYLLLYLLGYSFPPFPAINALVRAAEEIYSKRLVIFGERPPYPEYREALVIADAGPEEFLSWIQHSSAVITTSFHGTIFSLLFERQFFSAVGGKAVNDHRIFELLSQLGLAQRAVALDVFARGGMPLDPSGIDYAPVNERLRDLRRKSLTFLQKELA